MTTLVVVAHPDDETLAAGGTITAARQRGDRVHVAVACSAQRVDRHEPNAEAAKNAEMKAAMRTLDCTFECYRFPDQGLDVVPLIDLARAMERTIAAVTPQLVITHAASDVNQDHRRVTEAVLVACRPIPGAVVRRVEGGYVPSSSEWGAASFAPNVYRSLDPGHVDRKLAAMRCYESEMCPTPHPRSEHGIRAALVYFGSCVGVAFAEPFVLLREIT